MFAPAPAKRARCRVLYVSPLKALAVDVERNLRAPLAGIARVADGARRRRIVTPAIAIRTGDTPAARTRALSARAGRHPHHDARVALPAADLERARGAPRASRRSSSTRSTRSCRPSAARTWRCRSSGSRRAASGRRSGSACRRRSGRSTRWRGFSAASATDAAGRVAGGRDPLGRTGSARQAGEAPPTASVTRDRRRVRDAARHVRYRPVTIVDAGAKKALQARDRSAGRGHGAAARAGATTIPERAGLGRRRAAVDLVGDPSAAARADSRASLDADLRQQPPARRAAGRRAERAGRRNARPLAPRLDRARAARRRSKTCSRPARCARSSPPRRSSSASTWAPSISSSRSRRRRRSRAACSASAAAAIRSTRSARASSFPKFRGDLVACAAVAKAMHDGAVEATRYPRNPLDIVAQQIVAMAVDGRRGDVDELFATIRRAAPFAELSRARRSTACSTCCRDAIRRTSSPSCGRASPGTGSAGTVVAREGAKRVAIANGGTIPDRGLYGVFLVGRRPGRRARRRARRGDGVREPRRRDVRARRLVVADRGDHARPRARLAGAGRAGQDAVLERRSRRAAARARPRDRPADARPAARCRRRPPSIG